MVGAKIIETNAPGPFHPGWLAYSLPAGRATRHQTDEKRKTNL